MTVGVDMREKKERLLNERVSERELMWSMRKNYLTIKISLKYLQ